MSEGYKKGDACNECGRTVERVECSSCNGTGKPFGEWVKVTNQCPRCMGKGHSFKCPVCFLRPLSYYLHGLTNKS